MKSFLKLGVSIILCIWTLDKHVSYSGHAWPKYLVSENHPVNVQYSGEYAIWVSVIQILCSSSHQVHSMPGLLHGRRLHQILQRSLLEAHAGHVLRCHVNSSCWAHHELRALRSRPVLRESDWASKVQHQCRLSSTAAGNDRGPLLRRRANARTTKTGKLVDHNCLV